MKVSQLFFTEVKHEGPVKDIFVLGPPFLYAVRRRTIASLLFKQYPWSHYMGIQNLALNVGLYLHKSG